MKATTRASITGVLLLAISLTAVLRSSTYTNMNIAKSKFNDDDNSYDTMTYKHVSIPSMSVDDNNSESVTRHIHTEHRIVHRAGKSDNKRGVRTQDVHNIQRSQSENSKLNTEDTTSLGAQFLHTRQQNDTIYSHLQRQKKFHDLVINTKNGLNSSSGIDNNKDQHNNNFKSTKRKNRNQSSYHYHDYAIFIVHYHKTGYVLSRELKHQLISTLEVAAHRPDEKASKYSNLAKFNVSGIDEETGERVAFDQIGNWVNSAFPQRQHLYRTNCPPGSNVRRTLGNRRPITNDGKEFKLKRGAIYIQESPDLYCNDDELSSALPSSMGGTKIIHLVRNPFEMTLSNYYYHSQDPSPERWGKFSFATCSCMDVYAFVVLSFITHNKQSTITFIYSAY